MTTLTEGNLQITFPRHVNVRHFDNPDSHGLSQYMKSVDFIVEENDRILFIEFKDPDDPRARAEAREKFVDNFRSGKLTEDLKYKYRDSFLYEWASNNIGKPVYYWVLVGMEKVTEADLLARTDDLKRRLPVLGPRSGVWTRQIVADCMIFNVQTWNRHLPDFPVSRLGP